MKLASQHNYPSKAILSVICYGYFCPEDINNKKNNFALVFGGDAVVGIFQFIFKAGFWLIIALLVLFIIGFQLYG